MGWNETHLSKLNLWRKVYQQHSCKFSNFKPRSMPKWMSSTFNWIPLPPHSFSPPLYPLYDFFELVKSFKLVSCSKTLEYSNFLALALFSHYYYFTSIEGQSCINVKSRNPLISTFIVHLYFFTKLNRILLSSLFNELVKYSAMIC